MQVKEIKTEGLNRELEITVPAKDIDGFVERRLREVGKTIKMSGFRPGKVPLAILKKRYGRAIMGEVLEQTVNESTAKVLQDKGLKPAAQPKIEVGDFDEGKDLTYKVAMEVLPEFKIMDIKDLKLEKPTVEVSETEIDETLERIASQNQASQKIEGDRKTKKGDIVVIDFDGRTKDDDVHHEGMAAQGHKLELGSGQFIPGFEEQLIGKTAGEKVEVEVDFPEDYGATELAGRKAIFDVDIHEIHEKTDAKIDDELAKQLGFDDLEALKNAVKHQISTDYESHSRLKLKRQLLDTLDEGHKFEAPAGMVETEYQNIMTQVEQQNKAQQDSELKDLSDEEKEELKDIAERRVRLGLVLAEIGNANNIVVSNQELQQAVISEAQKYPGQEKAIFDFYQKNQQAIEGLRAPVFEEKVVDFIIGQAEVSEKTVSVEELTNHEDEDEAPKPKKAKSKKKAASKKEENSEEKPKAKKSPAKKSSKKKSD